MTTAPTTLSARTRRAWSELAGAMTEWCDITPMPTGPAARWLERSAPACVPAHRGVVLRMHGEIRLGRWRPFRAEQIITARGFVWAARAGRFPITIRGHDRCGPSGGEMDWRLLGSIPVMRRSDHDVWRSAAGRHAAELLVLIPCFGRTHLVAWSAGDDGEAIARVTLGRFTHRITLRVDEDGRLHELVLPRWGNPDGAGFREEPFGVRFETEHRLEGHVIPGAFRAGWWPGTERWGEGEFFRCVIDDAEFL